MIATFKVRKDTIKKVTAREVLVAIVQLQKVRNVVDHPKELVKNIIRKSKILKRMKINHKNKKNVEGAVLVVKRNQVKNIHQNSTVINQT